MRILLTHPYCWPHVRRGAERFLEELSRYLVRRGHEITILTSTPGGDGAPRKRDDGAVVVEKRQLNGRVLRALGLTPDKTFLLHCLRFMFRHRFDAMHCIHFHDACAARLAGMFTGTPYILNMNGIPIARFLMRRPLDFVPLKLALQKASDVVVISNAAAASLETEFRHSGVLIPPPCDLAAFSLSEGRDLQKPKILAVGAFAEARKGASVLVSAFERLKLDVPGAILQFSGDVPREVQEYVLSLVAPSIHGDIQFLGVGRVEDLPGLYQTAAVTVLPSIFEAFGMVLVESLACGTPVVGTDDGGIPDIIEEGIGVLFHPGSADREPNNVEGLHRALLEALELHDDPNLSQRCRRRAENYSWEFIGPQIEALYRKAKF